MKQSLSAAFNRSWFESGTISISFLSGFFRFLRFYIPVNSYGHVNTLSSPCRTLFWAILTKRKNQFIVHTLLLLNQQLSLNQHKDENDRRNYFMINLTKSMVLGQGRTFEPCIFSWTSYLPCSMAGVFSFIYLFVWLLILRINGYFDMFLENFFFASNTDVLVAQ